LRDQGTPWSLREAFRWRRVRRAALESPLRIVRKNSEVQGGISAQLFPMMEPLGTHGFPQPKLEKAFDLGSLRIHQMIRSLATEGRELDFDPGPLNWSCTWPPPLN